MPSHRATTRKEIFVALTLLVGAALWLFTPALAQPEGYFPFADQRRWRLSPLACSGSSGCSEDWVLVSPSPG